MLSPSPDNKKGGENYASLPSFWKSINRTQFIRDYFTALFSRLPGLNLATLVAGILISFPVCGFLPVLALLLATEKVPNPVKANLSPFFNAFVTVLANALRAFSAAAFEILASFPMLAINSAFVIQITSFFFTQSLLMITITK